MDAIIKEASRLFSLAVCTYGRCERCGSRRNLSCSHIIKRRYLQTLTSFRNAHCLGWYCCHSYFEDHPLEFKEWVETTWAKEYLQSEHRKNLLKEYRPPVDWEQRIEVSKKVISGEIPLFLARIKDL